LAASPPLLGDAAFHCQQATEKALKAFLTWHDRPFRKTHDLVELGAECVAIDPALEPYLRGTAPLTEYAWRYRYPGEPSEPEQSEVRQALDRARAVVALVLDRLPTAAHP
jgi:HEPN domain-containing protein